MIETTVEKLDLRSMHPFERHDKIFEVWNGLKAGRTLEITNDHDPKPLRYQFQAEYPNTFEWEYKQQGPKDWVVQIKKVACPGNIDQKSRIKEVFRKLHSGGDISAIKNEAKQALKGIGPTEMAALEQELIKEGMSRDEIMKLCDVHLEVMAENLQTDQIIPEQGHPIHTMMEEHKVILGYLDKLEKIIAMAKNNGTIDGVRRRIADLGHIAHHLVEAEKHYQREEEVIFPMLEKYGITEPPEIMKLEHVELRKRKKSLYEITQNPPDNYEKFLKGLEDAGEYIVRELAKHIFKEDNILYQAALKTFKPEDWAEIKKKCDKIGYCCFTPHYQHIN
ncbi:MAG: DUF438 domain-containing protein [Planctomycetota bacterium]